MLTRLSLTSRHLVMLWFIALSSLAMAPVCARSQQLAPGHSDDTSVATDLARYLPEAFAWARKNVATEVRLHA